MTTPRRQWCGTKWKTYQLIPDNRIYHHICVELEQHTGPHRCRCGTIRTEDSGPAT